MIETRQTLRQAGIRQRSLRKHCRLGRATELIFVLATGATVVIGGSTAMAADLQFSAGGGTFDAPIGGPGHFDNTGGNWTNGATASQVLNAADNAFFGGAVGGVTTPDTASGYNAQVGDNTNGSNLTVTVQSVTVNSDITFNSGHGDDSLDINGQLLVASGNTLNLSAPIADTLIIGNNTPAFDGTLNISGGSGGAVTQQNSSGTVNINGGTYGGNWNTTSGATIVNSASTISGNLDLDGGTAQINANLNLNSGTGTLDIASGVLATSSSSVTITGNVSSATATFTLGSDVTGDLTVSGGQTTANAGGGTIDVGGVVSVTGGELEITDTLNVQDNLASGTDVSISSGATLDVNGALTADTVAVAGNLDLAGNIQGQLSASSGADVDIDGNSTISGGASIASGATIDIDNALDLGGNNLQVLGAASVAGNVTGSMQAAVAGAITVDGDSTVTAGINVDATGSLTVNESLNAGTGISSQGNVSINIGASDSLTGGIAAHAGNVTLSGNQQGNLNLTGLSAASNGFITGASTISSGVTIGGNANAASLDVAASSGLDAGTGIALNSNGSLDFDDSITGNVTIANGATLYHQNANLSGNLTNGGAGNASIAGNIGGTYTHNAGTTNIDGASSITGAVSVADGTVQVNSGVNSTLAGGLTVGDSSGAASSANFNIVGNSTISGAAVTINSDGSLNISNGFSTDNQNLVNNGGIIDNANDGNHTIDLGTGTYTAQGTIDAGAGAVTISAATIALRSGHSATGTVNLDANQVDYGVAASINGNQTSDILVSTGGAVNITASAIVGVANDGNSSNGNTNTNDTVDVIVQSGGDLTVDAGQTLTADSFDIQAGGDVSIGAGSSLIGTGNTYNNAGNVTIAAGGSIVDDGAINNLATGVITIEGDATINADDNGDDAVNDIVTNAGTINIDSADAGNFTVSIGNDSLSNSGTISIGDNDTLSGITTLSNSGDITIGNNIGLGQPASELEATAVTSTGGTITVSNRAIYDVDNTTVTGATSSFIMGGSGGSTVDGALNLHDGVHSIEGGTFTGNVVIGNDDGVTSTVTTTNGRVIIVQNNSAFTVNDEGTLTITNNTLTGALDQDVIILEGGTLTQRGNITGDIAINDGNATITGTGNNVNGDILVGDSDGTAASLRLNGALNLANRVGNSLIVGSDGTLDIDNSVTGTAGNTVLEVNGGGVTSISNSTITGNIALNNGTITIDTSASEIDGDVTVGNGTDTASFVVDIATTFSTVTDNINVVTNGTLDVNAGLTGSAGQNIITNDGGTVSIGGTSAMTVVGDIALNSGTATIDGSDTVTFNSDIAVGDGAGGNSTLTVSNDIALNDSTDEITVNSDGVLVVSADVAASAGTVDVIDVQGGAVTIGTSSVTGNVDVDSGTASINGATTIDGDLLVGDGAGGAGSATVGAALSFADAGDQIVVDTDGTLDVNANLSAPASTDTVLDINGGNASIGASSITGSIAVDGTTLNIDGSSTVDGAVTVGAAAAGELDINSSQTLTITDKVTADSDGTVDINGNLVRTVTAGTVLDVEAGTASIAASSIGGNIEIDGGNVTVDGAATVDGGITVGDGAGTFGAGELEVAAGQSLTLNDAADTITVNQDGTLDLNGALIGTDDATADVVLTGTSATGPELQIGANVTGDIDVQDGLASLDAASTIDGSVTIGDGDTVGAEFDVTGFALTILDSDNFFTVQNEGVLDINANVTGTDTIAVINSNGTASIAGAVVTGDLLINEGTVTIDGSSTVDGDITVGDAAGAAQSSELEIVAGQTLVMSGTDDLITVDADGLLDIDGTLDGTNGSEVVRLIATTAEAQIDANVNGDIDIEEGIVTIGSAVAIDGSINVGDGDTDAASLDIAAATTISSGDSITVEDDGTLDIDALLDGTNGQTAIALTGDANTAALTIDANVNGDIDIQEGSATIGSASSIDGSINVGDGDAVTSNLDVAAATTISSGDVITVEDDGTLDIDAALTGTNGQSVVALTGDTNTAALTIDANVTGDIDIQEGSATIGSASSIDGSINVGDGDAVTSNLDIAAATTISSGDVITVEDDGTLDIDALLDGTNGETAIVLTGDTNTADLTIDANVNGDIDLQDGDATIGSAVVIDGSIEVGDGDLVTSVLDIAAATTINSGDSITVEDDGTLDIDALLDGTNGETIIALTGNANTAALTIDANVSGDIDIQEGTATIGSASTIDGSVNVGDSDGVSARLDVDAATSITSGDVITVDDDGFLDVAANLSGNVGETVILMQGSNDGTNEGATTIDADVIGDIDIQDGDAEIATTGARTITGSITVGDGDQANGVSDEDRLSNVNINNALVFGTPASNSITVNDDGRLNIASTLAGADGSDVLVVNGANADAQVTIAGPSLAGDIAIDSGNVTISSALAMDGSIALGDDNTSDAASLVVDGALDLTTGADDSIVVEDDGTLVLNANLVGTTGATVLDVVGNAGTASIFTNNSTITGDVLVDSGTFRVNGPTTLNDAFTLGDASGATSTLIVSSAQTLDLDGAFAVRSDARITLGSNSTLDFNGVSSQPTFDNGSRTTFNSGASLLGSPLVNGYLNAEAGGGSIDGTGSAGGITFGSSSNIDLANSTTGDSFTITDPSGVTFSGGTVQLDVDLTDGSTSTDTIVVNGGTSSGTVTVALNDVTADGAIYGALPDGGLVLIDNQPGSTLTATGNVPIDPNGSVTYAYGVNSGGDVVLLSAGSAAVIGLNGAIAAAQSLIAATINRPTSPFVTSLSNRDEGQYIEDAVVSSQGEFKAPAAPGTWIRFTAGRAEGETTAIGRNTVTSDTTSTYSGFQIGGDFTKFESSADGGWDLSYGATIGFNQATTVQPIENTALGVTGSITTLDLEQYYAGLYLVGVTGRFSFDLQGRYEHTEYTVNSKTRAGPGLNVDDTKFETNAFTFSGAASYTLNVPGTDNMFLVPTAGLSVTKTGSTKIELTNGDEVKFDETLTKVAFAGATLAWANFNENTGAQTAVFGTLTRYNNLSEDPTSTVFFTGGGSESVSASTLPDYSELSIGYVYNRETGRSKTGTLRKISASIRADARVGKDFESTGITGQFRLQF